MVRLSLGQSILGLALFFGAVCPAIAGSLTVDPVRLSLSAAEPIGALTVRNTGTDAAVLQLETYSWSQQSGRDVYAPSKEILATPPIFTVPAGGSQIVRVGLRRASDPRRELAYRLYLQEVPPPPRAGFQGLQVALRIGVPVFVAPIEAVKPALSWEARRAPQGALELSATNAGNAHIQIADFRLLLPGQDQPLRAQHVSGYVLAGQSRTWLLEPKGELPSGKRLQVSARTNAGEVHADVAPERP